MRLAFCNISQNARIQEIGLWSSTSLSRIFQLYRGVSFIGGWNRSTRRKPPIWRKSLTNFITYCCIKYTSQSAGLEFITLMVLCTDYIGSCKSNYHTITKRLSFAIIMEEYKHDNLDLLAIMYADITLPNVLLNIYTKNKVKHPMFFLNDKWYNKYHEITDQIISRTQWWPVRTLHWL